MRRRYLFFDYDGTLRSYAQGRIPASAEKALELLRRNGHHVALATGRLQLDALNLVRDSGITTLVADGGNSVTVDGRLRWMEPMPLERCVRFLHWLEEHGFRWAVTVRNELVRYTPFEDFANGLPDSYIRTEVNPELDADGLERIFKIFVPCAPGEEDGVDFGGVTWARYIPEAIYCEPTDKSVGIRKMMDILHAPYGDVVVFGDGTNDRDMFCPEWTSVAMGNAIDDLKDKADLVTTSVDEDGVYNACMELGLI